MKNQSKYSGLPKYARYWLSFVTAKRLVGLPLWIIMVQNMATPSNDSLLLCVLMQVCF